jgi:hypothetical protein
LSRLLFVKVGLNVSPAKNVDLLLRRRTMRTIRDPWMWNGYAAHTMMRDIHGHPPYVNA